MTLNVPEELKSLRQWVCWRLEHRDGEPKPTKVPYRCSTRREENGTFTAFKASHAKPESWSTFRAATNALARPENRFDGIGFVFSETDPFAGVDFDNCIDGEGNLSPFAAEWLQQLNSFAEISPSGTGVKVFVRATIPENEGRKNAALGIEIYNQLRFFTLTGNRFPGTPLAVEGRQEVIAALYETVFPTPKEAPTAPLRTITVELDDRELLDRMFAAKNGSDIRALWDGDTTRYNGDDSAAVFAFLNHLAFWTGRDEIRIDRLFRQSGLFARKWANGKWDLRCQEEIRKACAGTTEVYRGGNTLTLNANGKHPPTATEEEPPPPPPLDEWESDEPWTRFSMTDTGNAERFVDLYGSDVRHVAGQGWFKWDGSRWVKDLKDLLVLDLTKKTVRSIYGEAADCPDKTGRKAIAEFAKRSESVNRRQAILQLACAEEAIKALTDRWDSNPWLFNCRNGTMELDTGVFREHRREDFITKTSPVVYDPKAECPLFDRFVDQIFDGKEDMIDFVIRAFGSTLSGYTPDRALFILYGQGDNGKSTLVELVAEILGDYATSCRPETLTVRREEGIPNDIAELRGKRFVFTSETQEGARLNEGKVKQMTGNDTLKGRFLNQEFFDFRPEFKLFLDTNHKPVIKDTTNSIWNRLKLIPFAVIIPKEKIDRNLKTKLRAEAPGVLNRLLEGCREWRETGLRPPEEVTDATSNYRGESDSLQTFFEDYCYLSPDVRISKADLYSGYKQWCAASGEHYGSINEFGKKLIEKGFQDSKSMSVRYWKGIALSVALQEPPPPQ